MHADGDDVGLLEQTGHRTGNAGEGVGVRETMNHYAARVRRG